MSSQPGGTASPLRAWPQTSGIAFAVLSVLGVVIGAGTPQPDASDQEWVDYFTDGGHRALALVGAIALALAALSLLCFSVGLARRLRAVLGPDAASPTFVVCGGALYSLILVVGAAVLHQASLAHVFGPAPYDYETADVLRISDSVGYLTILMGALFAGVMVAAAAVGGHRAGLLPNWLRIAGWVTAAAMLIALGFFPIVLLPLWVLAASIAWLRVD